MKYSWLKIVTESGTVAMADSSRRAQIACVMLGNRADTGRLQHSVFTLIVKLPGTNCQFYSFKQFYSASSPFYSLFKYCFSRHNQHLVRVHLLSWKSAVVLHHLLAVKFSICRLLVTTSACFLGMPFSSFFFFIIGNFVLNMYVKTSLIFILQGPTVSNP